MLTPCVRYRERVDVAIAGGGLIGLSLAWRLTQAGASVTVWDSGQIGREASWAGAGMLAPGGELEERSWWSDLAIESLRIYPQFVRELTNESGIPIDYRACGALQFCHSDEEWEALQLLAEAQRSWGIASEVIGERTLFYPNDAAVNPRDLLLALKRVCERNGVVIREHSEVRKIVVRSGRVVIPEPAGAALLAAGAWSSEIEIEIDGSILELEPAFPVRGHLISFAPVNPIAGPILRDEKTYILERADGQVIAGSTMEQAGFDRNPNSALFDEIERRAQALLPALQGRHRTAEWIGFRPATRSGEPQLRQLEGAPVFLAYGHFRNGILMAPGTALLMTEKIISSLRMGSSSPSAHH